MPTDSTTQSTLPLEQLIHLQLNSAFIAHLDMPGDVKVNLGCWQGQVIEIHCHRQQQQWVPVAVQYQNMTPEYTTHLSQHLTYSQLKQINKTIEAYTFK